ncbi:MAG: molecular chaperone DnaK [Dehalococcoidia bacterium]|jgi:molecular chaperone DnaK
MSRAVGIDLGTTNSCVAVMEGGVPVIIPGAGGEHITPSVVSADAAGHRFVGSAAKQSAIVNAENTVLSIKRLMGCRFHEPENTATVEHDRRYAACRIDESAGHDVRVWMAGKPYSPPEISAMVLQQLKAGAEAYLGEEVKQAVITVPAHFNDSQRQATRDAGAIAGLDVLRIINEPTAAALAYGLDRKKSQTIAVYDLGGGTFDISILELCEGTFEVRAVNGDTHLGGDDIDRRVVDWLCRLFAQRQGVDLRGDRTALQRLKDAAERAKQELSTRLSAEISLPYITGTASGAGHLQVTLTRSILDELAADLVERTIDCCRQALRDAELTVGELDEIVLVGGQTRMPLVPERVRRFFGREPHTGLNPDEVVALGAAVQAGVLTGKVGGVLLLDVTPLTLGVETRGGIATPLIKRNTTIPTSASRVFTTAADDQSNVEINVVQGERAMAAENRSLGRFCLEDIPPAPRGEPQIEVTFAIDADGIVQVRACDKATEREKGIVVRSADGLSEAEIERMRTEAKQFAAIDSQRQDEIATRNRADSCILRAETALASLDAEDARQMGTAVIEKIAALRRALREGKVRRIEMAQRALESALTMLDGWTAEELDAAKRSA